jgi:hypothetical protein
MRFWLRQDCLVELMTRCMQQHASQRQRAGRLFPYTLIRGSCTAAENVEAAAVAIAVWG